MTSTPAPTSPRAALKIWRHRGAKPPSERWYLVYLTLAILGIVVAPIIRVCWLALLSPSALRALTAPAAPMIALIAAAIFCIAALLLGRQRGPALRPAFLTQAFTDAPFPLVRAFAGPVWLAAAILMLAGALVAGFPGLALLAAGLADPPTTISLIIAGAAAGLTIALSGLLGQGWPRLDPQVLRAQATRWETSSSIAQTLDFSAAAGVYAARPRRLRRAHAVRFGRPAWWVMARRSVVGMCRSPGRLALGTIGVALAGVLLGTALVIGASESTSPWLAAAGRSTAALIAYLAIGPFSSGLQQAVLASLDVPLFGSRDGRLVLGAALVPFICASVVVTGLALGAVCILTAQAASLTVALGLPSGLLKVASIRSLGAVFLGLLLSTAAVAVKAMSLLKGDMPAALLTPIPTPAGDPNAIARLIWALDGPVLAALSGAAVVLASTLPVLSILAIVLIAWLAIARWRGRRA